MNEIKQIARHALGASYEPLRDFFWSIFGLGERTAVVWVACYVLIAFAVYVRREAKREEPLLAGFARYLFPRDVYTHPSARLDFIFFAVDKLLLFCALGTIAISSDATTRALLQLFPARGPTTAAPWAVGLATLATFLAFDLGAFVWHLLTHRVALLWAFHRVHHAAEVLTPISNYREHPVDSLGRSLLQGLLVGVAQAAVRHVDNGALPIAIGGVNALYLPAFVLSNARHSHVWVSFGRFWSHLFNSPAQHQCHHGTAPEHIDVNYGLVLSVWDWMIGTLYIPRAKDVVRYGLVGEQRPFPTVLSLYLRPFRDAWTTLTRHPTEKDLVLGPPP